MKERDTMETVGAILLAAGNSTRFGANKLLHRIDGKSMAERCMEKCLAVSFAERVIVTQYDEVEVTAGRLGMDAVRNRQPDLGISHSIALGIKALNDMDAWMFLVCDQPWLKADTVQNLLETYQKSPKGIAALRCGEMIGNPVIFSKAYQTELESLKGDKGGKKILLANLEDVEFVEADRRELEDMDEPVITSRKEEISL